MTYYKHIPKPSKEEVKSLKVSKVKLLYVIEVGLDDLDKKPNKRKIPNYGGGIKSEEKS